MTTGDRSHPALLVYVHEDRLGDALLKLPAMAALRRAFPKHRITWWAGCGPSVFGSSLAPLAGELVDEVQDHRPLGRSWREVWQGPPAGLFYDVIIDTQTVIRSSLALRRIPHRLFISPAARFLFSDRRPAAGACGGSIRQRLMRLIELAAGRSLEAGYRLELPEELRQLAAALLPEGPEYIGLAPGAGGRDKCWPLTRFLDLACEQRERGRTPVFFIGPDEKAWLPQIRERAPDALVPEAEDAARDHGGPLLCLALAQRLAAAVANDSGIGHVLSFAGAPLVTLFGHTSEEKFVEQPARRVIVRAADHGGRDVTVIPAAAVSRAVEQAVALGKVAA